MIGRCLEYSLVSFVYTVIEPYLVIPSWRLCRPILLRVGDEEGGCLRCSPHSFCPLFHGGCVPQTNKRGYPRGALLCSRVFLIEKKSVGKCDIGETRAWTRPKPKGPTHQSPSLQETARGFNRASACGGSKYFIKLRRICEVSKCLSWTRTSAACAAHEGSSTMGKS